MSIPKYKDYILPPSGHPAFDLPTSLVDKTYGSILKASCKIFDVRIPLEEIELCGDVAIKYGYFTPMESSPFNDILNFR